MIFSKNHPFTARDSTLRERQGSQLHFIELCDLLGEPRPAEPESYCFERGAKKAGGGDGWADVWRKGCFAWEYKGKHEFALAELLTGRPVEHKGNMCILWASR